MKPFAWFFLFAAFATGSATCAPLLVMVTDPAGKPVEGAVITVSVPGAPKTAAPGTTAQMAQQNRQFAPRILVVQAGTAVSFPNLDTVRHHVYSFSPIKPFELALYAGTPSAPIVFDKVGTAVLGCNIHDKMSAWVVVVDTPYFARTDAAGRAQLDIPEGEHALRAWHPLQAEPAVPVERRVHAGSPVALTLSAAAP
jgi:plastocyanin